MALVGESCALGAAIVWAGALCLFKRSGETIPPLSLCLFKNTIGIVLLALTIPLVGESFADLAAIHPGDICLLLISGIVGIAIADTLLFYSLNMIGVGLLTIVECAYTPSVVASAWLFLAEDITPGHYAGGGLILLAVFLSSTHKPLEDKSRKELIFGSVLGATAVALMGMAIVVVKPILEEVPLITSSLVRLVGGTAVLAVVLSPGPDRAKHFAVFRPSAAWRVSIPASVLGTYVAMLLWIAGFKYAGASIAAILNQTSTILALVFASLFLREPFTKRKCVAALLAFAGVIIATLWQAAGA